MLTGQRKSIFPIRLTQRPCLLTANPLFFKSLLISHACGISFRLRSAGFNVPLDHIVLVAVLLRGHPDHFPELLDKMTLGRKRKPVRDINHGIIAEPEKVLSHIDLLASYICAHRYAGLFLKQTGQVTGRYTELVRQIFYRNPFFDV